MSFSCTGINNDSTVQYFSNGQSTPTCPAPGAGTPNGEQTHGLWLRLTPVLVAVPRGSAPALSLTTCLLNPRFHVPALELHWQKSVMSRKGKSESSESCCSCLLLTDSPAWSLLLRRAQDWAHTATGTGSLRGDGRAKLTECQ